MRSDTIASPFAASVAPVLVLSTIMSASSGGYTSVAPNERTTSASTPAPFAHVVASRTYSEAITRRRAGSLPFSRNSTGAAATRRTGSSPVSNSSTRSAPSSATQSAPANPRSREPWWSISTMLCGFSSFTSKSGRDSSGL